MSRNPWSESEISLLKDSFSTSTWDELLLILPDRSRGSIEQKANSLGLARPRSDVWTEEEEALLREHYPSSTWDTLLSVLPSRSKNSIMFKAQEQGIQRLLSVHRVKSNSWSESEVTLLREYYPTATWGELFSLFPNRNRRAIYSKAKSLGLSKYEREVYLEMNHQSWTVREVDFLYEHFPNSSWSFIMDNFPHRSRASVRSKAVHLGIERLVSRRGRPLKWSEEQVQILREYYPVATWDTLRSLLPEFSDNAIRTHALKLGIKRQTKRASRSRG